MDAYLSRNHQLALQLVGANIRGAVRLMDQAPVEDIRAEWGPVVLSLDSGAEWLLDANESQANLIIRDYRPDLLKSSLWYAGFVNQVPLIEATHPNPLGFLLTKRVVAVEIISREPEDDVPGFFTWCGIRVTVEGGNQVCIGTHLTDLLIPGVSFLLPDEVDLALTYRSLGDGIEAQGRPAED